MTDLNKLLRDGDPLNPQNTNKDEREPTELSPADVQVIRRAMLEAAQTRPTTSSAWQRPLAWAAVAIVLIGVGGVAGHRINERVSTEPRSVDTGWLAERSGSSGDINPRQVQFATPGGTRIIWILDPNSTVQESMR
jgi:hypothetical protein